jgi:hypothetical protein
LQTIAPPLNQPYSTASAADHCTSANRLAQSERFAQHRRNLTVATLTGYLADHAEVATEWEMPMHAVTPRPLLAIAFIALRTSSSHQTCTQSAPQLDRGGHGGIERFATSADAVASVAVTPTAPLQFLIALERLLTMAHENPSWLRIDHICRASRHTASASRKRVNPRPMTSQPGSPLFLM